MKRVIGLILFWIAVGMLLMMIIDKVFVGIIIIIACILVGYNLYCS